MAKKVLTTVFAALFILTGFLLPFLMVNVAKADSIADEFAEFCESYSETEVTVETDPETGEETITTSVLIIDNTEGEQPEAAPAQTAEAPVQTTEEPAQETKPAASKPAPAESPAFYSEEMAIEWAKNHGMDGFMIEMFFSGTTQVCAKKFSSMEEALAYLMERKNELIAANGGKATIEKGFVQVDGSAIVDDIKIEKGGSYNANPVVAIFPVIETDCSEHLSFSAKNKILQTVADKVGVEASKIIVDRSYVDGVARMTFSYTTEMGHNIATYIIDTVETAEGARMVLRPEKVMTKKAGESLSQTEYAVYELSQMPMFKATAA